MLSCKLTGRPLDKKFPLAHFLFCVLRNAQLSVEIKHNENNKYIFRWQAALGCTIRGGISDCKNSLRNLKLGFVSSDLRIAVSQMTICFVTKM
jgi:hypothetical protein